MHFIKPEIEGEAERLLHLLLNVQCEKDRVWNWETCLEIAPLTLEINQLKKEKSAVILAHSYTYPEIIYGVADFKSDSYALALEAKNMNAKVILFAGVVFMAETAKILCPDAQVIVPDINSGCSLADSLTASELRELQKLHPHALTVCYINSSAEVKALSHVVVTSANVVEIISKLPTREILFVPDKLMALNVQRELFEKGIDKIIHSSEGTCIVHDKFNVELIKSEREHYPDLKVVSHPECPSDVAMQSDFVGSTGKMMDYVKKDPDHYFMMLTECGLVSRLEVEAPGAKFISSCKLCPYMKLNTLTKIRDALRNPQPDQIIHVDESVRLPALAAIERMFSLSRAK